MFAPDMSRTIVFNIKFSELSQHEKLLASCIRILLYTVLVVFYYVCFKWQSCCFLSLASKTVPVMQSDNIRFHNFYTNCSLHTMNQVS